MGPWPMRAFIAAPPVQVFGGPRSNRPAYKRDYKVPASRPRTSVPASLRARTANMISVHIFNVSGAGRPRASTPAIGKREHLAGRLSAAPAVPTRPWPPPAAKVAGKWALHGAECGEPAVLGTAGGQPPVEPIKGRAAVAAAIEHRRLTRQWRLPAFATHGDRRLFYKLSKVSALIDQLPATAFSLMLGERAAVQVGAADARALAVQMLEAKAGPEGDNASKATRALKLLCARAEKAGLPNAGLPAGRALIASIVAAEGQPIRMCSPH